MTWQNRIVRSEDVAPDQLLANPWNYRIHSALQQRAIKDVLREVGWVRRVLVNERTGHVVDGHARIGVAMDEGQPTVPVDYIDVSAEDEKTLLAVLDPLAGLAGTDPEKLAELMSEIHESGNQALAQTLASLKPVTFMAQDRPVTHRIMIECESEHERSLLVQRLRSEGLQCRSL